MIKDNGKKIVVALLLLSCIVSGIILAASPPYSAQKLHTLAELDSLIHIQLEKSLIYPDHIRVSEVRVDSSFARNVYHVRVPQRFSKTFFHFNLHKALYKYDVQTPANVHFPARDMDIYIYGNNTVFGTIRLITDAGLDSIYYPVK